MSKREPEDTIALPPKRRRLKSSKALDLAKENALIDGCSLIHYACKTRDYALLEYCLEQGHDIEDCSFEEEFFYKNVTPLFHLIKRFSFGAIFDRSMIALLLDNRANIKCVDYYGGGILHSTHVGFVPSVNFFGLFFNRGADIEHRDQGGQTPLLSLFQEIIDSHSCYLRSDFESIVFLLKSGASPNSVDNNGLSPLLLHLNNIIFVEENDNTENSGLDDSFFVEIVVKLLSYGADDSMNFVEYGLLDSDEFVEKYRGAVTCRDVIIRRWGEGVYRLAERERLERMSQEVEEMELFLYNLVVAEKKDDHEILDFAENEILDFVEKDDHEILDFEKVIGENVCPMLFDFTRDL